MARKRAAALETRLPKLIVDVDGAPEGTDVQRDGHPIGSAAWGVAIPVDPGAHRISASAPGKDPWETTVEAGEGATLRVTVPRELATRTGPAAAKRGATRRTVGWLTAGFGAAAIGVGLGFGLSSLASRDESRTHCTGDACDAAGLRLRADAISSGSIATIATLAGGAAVAGGLMLVLTAPASAPSTHEPAGKLRATPTMAMGGGGLMLQGVFR